MKIRERTFFYLSLEIIFDYLFKNLSAPVGQASTHFPQEAHIFIVSGFRNSGFMTVVNPRPT